MKINKTTKLITSAIGISLVIPGAVICLNACASDESSSKTFDTANFKNEDYLPYVRLLEEDMFTGATYPGHVYEKFLVIPEGIQTVNLDLTKLKDLQVRFSYIFIPRSVSSLSIKADQFSPTPYLLYGLQPDSYLSSWEANVNQFNELNLDLSDGDFSRWELPSVKSSPNSAVHFKLDNALVDSLNFDRYANVANLKIELNNMNLDRSDFELPNIVDNSQFQLRLNHCLSYRLNLPANLTSIDKDMICNCNISNVYLPRSVNYLAPKVLTKSNLCQAWQPKEPIVNRPLYDYHDTPTSGSGDRTIATIYINGIEFFKPYFSQDYLKVLDLFLDDYRNLFYPNKDIILDFTGIEKSDFYDHDTDMRNIFILLRKKFEVVKFPDFLENAFGPDSNPVVDDSVKPGAGIEGYESSSSNKDEEQSSDQATSDYTPWPYMD